MQWSLDDDGFISLVSLRLSITKLSFSAMTPGDLMRFILGEFPHQKKNKKKVSPWTCNMSHTSSVEFKFVKCEELHYQETCQAHKVSNGLQQNLYISRFQLHWWPLLTSIKYTPCENRSTKRLLAQHPADMLTKQLHAVSTHKGDTVIVFCSPMVMM